MPTMCQGQGISGDLGHCLMRTGIEPRSFRAATMPTMKSLGCDVWMKEPSSS
jgi:hypothetical protein